MVSFYVPWLDAPTAHLVPTALGVAIVDTIAQTNRSVGLKWPNDVVVATGDEPELVGRKLGGMLSSSVVLDGDFQGVVAGLGCNVTWPPPFFDQLPEAAALDHLSGKPVTPRQLALSLVPTFDRQLQRVQTLGAGQLLDAYRTRCVTLGQRVRVEVGESVVTGRATDIDPSGSLLVDVDGRQQRIAVGDVVHLRSSSETN